MSTDSVIEYENARVPKIFRIELRHRKLVIEGLFGQIRTLWADMAEAPHDLEGTKTDIPQSGFPYSSLLGWYSISSRVNRHSHEDGQSAQKNNRGIDLPHQSASSGLVAG
jgi:hypothetical protein